jgi:hypothetical protein
VLCRWLPIVAIGEASQCRGANVKKTVIKNFPKNPLYLEIGKITQGKPAIKKI